MRSKLRKYSQFKKLVKQINDLIEYADSPKPIGKKFSLDLDDCLKNISQYYLSWYDFNTKHHMKSIRSITQIDDDNRAIVRNHLQFIKSKHRVWWELNA